MVFLYFLEHSRKKIESSRLRSTCGLHQRVLRLIEDANRIFEFLSFLVRVKYSLMIDSASQSVNIINCQFGYLIVNSRDKQISAPLQIESENVAGIHAQF